MEEAVVSGVATDKSQAKVIVVGIPDVPGKAAELFTVIADAGANIDMIVQNTATGSDVTDAVSDIRNLPGFTRVEEYGSFKPIHDREIGACEDFRFVSSPLLKSFLAAGASVGSSGMLSVGASNVDVYPFIVIGEDAWGQVALKGMSAIKPVVLKASQTNHANPLGQFGYVGASTWFATVRLNDAWMARIEAGVTAL